MNKPTYRSPRARDAARRRNAAKIAGNRKRGRGHRKPARKTASSVISPLTADLMGQMVILRVLENIGIRGRDIIELLAKAIVNPPPTAKPQESGPASSTKPKRARSKKKEKPS